MADDDLKFGPNEVALVRAAAFIDHEGDPIAIVIIGGIHYARMENTLTDAIETTRRTLDTLMTFQRSPTCRHVELGTPPRDPAKEN